jgi:peptidoglycan/xylan/chitin deacetylase (PgdA/CDA1 family)
MYHKVLPKELSATYALRNLVVDVTTFKQQMAWLAKHFNVMTVRNAVKLFEPDSETKNTDQRPIACVTFDDGYLDNFQYAAPVLDSFGLQGTFFITTGFVEGTPLWFDRATHVWQRDSERAIKVAKNTAFEGSDALFKATSLDAWLGGMKRISPASRATVIDAIDNDTSAMMSNIIFAPMNPDQICELATRGHEIGAHSVTHPILTDISDASLQIEIEQPRARLREWTGRPVEGFCYPNGNHDERIMNATHNAGYHYGCTVKRGMATSFSHRMALPRRAILASSRHETIGEGYQAEVVGWHDWLRKGKKRFA